MSTTTMSQPESPAPAIDYVGLSGLPISLCPFRQPGEKIPSIRRFYYDAMNGLIPGIYQTSTGRWRIPRSSLADVARYYKLTGPGPRTG